MCTQQKISTEVDLFVADCMPKGYGYDKLKYMISTTLINDGGLLLIRETTVRFNTEERLFLLLCERWEIVLINLLFL